MVCLCSLISSVISYLATFALYYYAFAVGFLMLYRLVNKTRATFPAEMRLREKKLMVVFGSGGHTTEMLLMLTKMNQFDFTKYKEVQFVIGHSDTWSLTKIKDFLSRGGMGSLESVENLKLIKLFRSREVKQSYVTSIGTTLMALAHSLWVIAKHRPDIVTINQFY